MSVTTNILQRTFHIQNDEITGTCFSVDVEGKRYLITAGHVVESIDESGVLEVSYKRNWVPLQVEVVGHGKEDIDVAVLAPEDVFGATHSLNLTMGHLRLGEDVYFLGFPYGLSMQVETKLNSGFPLPLVKKATVSALQFGGKPLLLDGHNNVGFSGGPVARRGTREGQTVIGVVAGYEADTESVRDEHGNETPYTYATNTGIVIAHDIKHALDMIRANPIGPEVE